MNTTCDAHADHCRCANGPDCDGVHVCDCGSSWSGDLDGPDFAIHVLPAASVLAGLLAPAIYPHA